LSAVDSVILYIAIATASQHSESLVL